MTLITNITTDSKIQWKDFIFPLSIKNFSLKEAAKVATYEYAWRNGAEFERVLSHRVFSISWEFIPWVLPYPNTPTRLVYKLRLTNDNKVGTFTHSNIWTFKCIMSNLSIDQTWEWYTIDDSQNNILAPSFSFSFELLEHTPPNAKTLKEKNDALFPKSNVKPTSDFYNSSLKYKNCTEMYEAILEWKILPWVNPVINSEWLKYDYDLRKCAYDKWAANGFKTNTTNVVAINISTVNTTQKYHIVKAWETGMKIAKLYWVPFTSLFDLNHWVKVRQNNYMTDWLYWKTTVLLQAGDKLLIPEWFKQPVKKKSLNRVKSTNTKNYTDNPNFIWPRQLTN